MQQGHCFHDHSGNAESTLRCALFQKRLLDWVKRRNIFASLDALSRRSHTFNRHHITISSAFRPKQTGLCRLAVHYNDAATTLAIVAGFLGSCQA